MVDVYAELLLGGQDVEDGGDKISPVIERGFGAVAHIGAVGQAVEVEHVARLAQDVVEIAVGASHVLLEVARRNGYAGDLAPQGKFPGGEGAGGGERIGEGLYIYGAVEEVVRVWGWWMSDTKAVSKWSPCRSAGSVWLPCRPLPHATSFRTSCPG